MGKYVVVNTFRDRQANRRRMIGEVFECSDERARLINESCQRQAKTTVLYVTKVESNDQPDEESDTVNSLKRRLKRMSAVELREYADQKHKLTFGESMKKAEMIAVILEYEKGKG